MSHPHPARPWLTAGGLLFFAAFVILSSTASTRLDRIYYGAPPVAAALACFGGIAWLSGRDIARRNTFTWRGMTYQGPRVKTFGRTWMAFGAGYWLLAAIVLAMWWSAK